MITIHLIMQYTDVFGIAKVLIYSETLGAAWFIQLSFLGRTLHEIILHSHKHILLLRAYD